MEDPSKKFEDLSVKVYFEQYDKKTQVISKNQRKIYLFQINDSKFINSDSFIQKFHQVAKLKLSLVEYEQSPF